MNKKAFTLIELLAVLIILAVIALIAFPLIGNVIHESERKAFERSVDGIRHAAEIDYQNDTYRGDREYYYRNGSLTLTSVNGQAKQEDVKLEGIIKNGTGIITIDADGNTSLKISNEEWCATKTATSKTTTTTEKTETNCLIQETLSLNNPKPQSIQ